MSVHLKTTNIKNKKLSYFREVQQELKKVTWTTKEELITYTKVVVAATFMFALGIYFADLVIRGSLNTISLISRFLIG